jgi:hypothetical protein
MANLTSSRVSRKSLSTLAVLCSFAATACVLPGATTEDEAVVGALRAALSGDAEVPGPGDPDGSGAAHFTSSIDEESLCVALTVEKLGSIGAAHLHRASIGLRGPVVLDLNFHTILPAPCGVAAAGRERPGSPSCEWPRQEFRRCLAVTQELLRAIHGAPEQFYISVHTQEFPDGAVRGQIEPE